MYEGNVPGEGGENTLCYACGSVLIERYGCVSRVNRVRDGLCPDCGVGIDGIQMDGLGALVTTSTAEWAHPGWIEIGPGCPGRT